LSNQIIIDQDWTYLLSPEGSGQLIPALQAYLPRCRWFQSKARDVRQVRILDAVPMQGAPTRLVFLSVEYHDDLTEVYLLPVKFLLAAEAEELIATFPNAAFAAVRCQREGVATDGYLIDSIYDERFRKGVLETINEQNELVGETGSVSADTTRALNEFDMAVLSDQSKLMTREQSNTSIKYGDALILKLMRKLEAGVNPELEIGRFLTEETTITHVPLLAGYMEYRRTAQPPISVAVLQGFVPNRGDAWETTLNWLEQWLESDIVEQTAPAIPSESLVILAQDPVPTEARKFLGYSLGQAELLGQRTAELHVALASSQIENFRPEPFSMQYQQDLFRSIEQMSERVFKALRARLPSLPPAVVPHAETVLKEEQEIRDTFNELRERDIPGKRIRGHGDYHLGQVLATEDDFVIVDFEGEPARPLPERYIKHSPLRDVAGMLRSYHYVAYGALPGFGVKGAATHTAMTAAERWARYWRNWVSVAFLRRYLEVVHSANIIPESIEDVDALLRILIMEKAIYELGYEVNNRPGWLKVPAQAIIRNVE
jgi:maltose alpha-D-glucosyltransferase/alpha-amylase